ncbi:hypothetical protein [Azospirillum sp. SYSU D00513]|uniref:hypothetical protein n=1 Tax=Azospirillum sp. SYSU D00513 TaxID=2812561 RepID=UPI001A963EDA|nr:hypothetical protein [Azospirillum sp. SYSU D00513]
MAEPALIIDHANRFEAIATDGFEGRPYAEALADLARRVRAHPAPGLPGEVARALGILCAMIEESAPDGRFARKVAILREAAERLRG